MSKAGLVLKELAVLVDALSVHQLLVVGEWESICMKRFLTLRIFPDLRLTPRLN